VQKYSVAYGRGIATDETKRQQLGHPAWHPRFERTLHRGWLPANRLGLRGGAAALLELHQKIDRSYKS